MSATEIITVIKAINDHVTVKYSGLIIDYLAEKKKAHLLFERELFNAMDKSVQQLINNMSRLFNATCEKRDAFKKIEMLCGEYNNWKKNKYDDHLLKMEKLERDVDVFIRQAFNAKVLEQHALFDEALSNSLNSNITAKDVMEEKQKRPEYVNNNNLYPTTDINLFNDNVTNSTIFSTSSHNSIKFTPQSDEEKARQNEPTHIPISLPQPSKIINNIPLYFPPLPLIKTNKQQDNTNNNQLKLPISFSTKKHRSSSNNRNVSVLNSERNSNTIMLSNENKQMRINSQIPPPKPPPPPPQIPVDCSVSELSDTSNMYSDTTIKNGKRYKCHICDKEFSDRLQREEHYATHDKSAGKIKSKIVTKTVSKSRAKKRKKRNFQKMCVDDKTIDTNKSNKRSCHRYQCEYCNKQYLRQTSYIKHYNNHMITNSNMQCNFCLNEFNDSRELKLHINEFGAGIAVDDGFYQCCKCTMRFESKEELTSHINSQHKISAYEERNKSVEFI